MIDDLELRALFKAESEEHLQTLEQGLLRLEADPHDTAVLEELFRSAHSLKGAAGMLGVESVETLAHFFEELLGATRHGRIVLTSAAADRLYHGLDAIRRLVREAIDGEPAHIDVESALAQMRGDVELHESPVSGAPGATDSAAAPAATEPSATTAGPTVLPDEPHEGPAPVFRIETVRVEPERLDALLSLAGEASVTTTQIARGMDAVDDLVCLWEEWSREALHQRLGSTAPEAGRGHAGIRGGQFQESSVRRLEQMGRLLERLTTTRSERVERLKTVVGDLDNGIRDLRMLPFSTLFNLFPRMVRDLSQELHKEVNVTFEGGTVTADKHLLEELKDPLMHMVRNALDHGIESPAERASQGKIPVATLRMRAARNGPSVTLEVADDGCGLDPDRIRAIALRRLVAPAEEIAALSAEEAQRLIFSPGFSTSTVITDLSGRGVGLDVVRANVERMKGTVTVESIPGAGCTFRLAFPISLATTRVLLVGAGGTVYAIPIEAVAELLSVPSDQIFPVEGRSTFLRAGRPVPAAELSDVLEIAPAPRAEARPDSPSPGSGPGGRCCVLLAVGDALLGLFVDSFDGEQEVILKSSGGLLKRVRNVLGPTLLNSGEICIVLNPHDLVHLPRPVRRAQPRAEAPVMPQTRKVVLLADDSITTRTQEKRILEAAGYEVVTAVDGADALGKLAMRAYDALVSDVEMPNLDGLALTERIRKDARYRELPIILVTSLASDADRRRGADAGANAYLTKGDFDQTALLTALRRLT